MTEAILGYLSAIIGLTAFQVRRVTSRPARRGELTFASFPSELPVGMPGGC